MNLGGGLGVIGNGPDGAFFQRCDTGGASADDRAGTASTGAVAIITNRLNIRAWREVPWARGLRCRNWSYQSACGSILRADGVGSNRRAQNRRTNELRA